MKEEQIIGKYCSRCEKEKSYTEFYMSTINKDGYDVWCRDCRTAYTQVYTGRSEKPSKRYRKKPSNIAVPEGYKYCLDCGQVKTLDEFANCISNSDGKQAYCRNCFIERNRISRENRKKRNKPNKSPN